MLNGWRLSLSGLVLLAWFFAGTSVRAAESKMPPEQAQQLFLQANHLYQQQNYAAARDQYVQLVQQGIQSPELYYNLGNAAARLGRTGEAVLYFERARELAPRDPDVQANLARVAPPGNDPAPFVLNVPFHWLLNRLSLREWMGTFLLLFAGVGLVGGLLLSRRLSPGLATALRPVLAAFVVFASVAAVFTFFRYYRQEVVSRAIVMQPETVVRSGPGDNFTEIATLPEGSKLRRANFSDPLWARIALPSGQPGYIRKSRLQTI